jgi:hypothetical protein
MNGQMPIAAPDAAMHKPMEFKAISTRTFQQA